MPVTGTTGNVGEETAGAAIGGAAGSGLGAILTTRYFFDLRGALAFGLLITAFFLIFGLGWASGWTAVSGGGSIISASSGTCAKTARAKNKIQDIMGMNNMPFS